MKRWLNVGDWQQHKDKRQQLLCFIVVSVIQAYSGALSQLVRNETSNQQMVQLIAYLIWFLILRHE